MSPQPQVYLGQASEILDGAIAIGGSGPRCAAILVRKALEQIVIDRCAELGMPARQYVSMRARLIVLSVLDDRERAHECAHAWGQLSAAVHQHAYELAPTEREVRTWCAVVSQLA